MGDHFPNHPAAAEKLTHLGVNPSRSYEQWILELAPQRARELLTIHTPNQCVICDTPVRPRQITCSGRCRTRLHRQQRQCRVAQDV